MTLRQRPLSAAQHAATLILITALAACSKTEPQHIAAPVEINAQTACSLDGMLLADYPGPKAQIHYDGQPQPEFFCDTIEMFHALLNPEQIKAVRAAYVQDMGKADWGNPRGHWIEAKQAVYVLGSKRKGSMGPTIASFAQEQDAQKFVAEYGGKVLRFTEIKLNMVDLSGGALHDSTM